MDELSEDAVTMLQQLSSIKIHKTGEPDIILASGGRLILSVPIQIKRRSG